MMFPKYKNWRSKKYKEWVARHPSFLSGRTDRNVPHHHRKGSDGGTGLRPSDVWCVPVTYDEHNEVHAGNIILDDKEVLTVCLKQIAEYLSNNNVK